MTQRRKRKTYTDEFKQQMVTLYNSGKPAAEIIREYELTTSTFHKWVKQANNTGFFKEKDNRTEEENRLIELEKEVIQLRMENDMLKDSETDRVVRILRDSRKSYGTRRIKAVCAREGVTLPRRRIGDIMKEEGLISVYTTMNYKVPKSKVNHDKIENLLKQAFDERDPLDSIISDLTYVRVGHNWHYI